MNLHVRQHKDEDLLTSSVLMNPKVTYGKYNSTIWAIIIKGFEKPKCHLKNKEISLPIPSVLVNSKVNIQ